MEAAEVVLARVAHPGAAGLVSDVRAVPDPAERLARALALESWVADYLAATARHGWPLTSCPGCPLCRPIRLIRLIRPTKATTRADRPTLEGFDA